MADNNENDLGLRDELLTFAYWMVGSSLLAERLSNHALASGEEDPAALFGLLTADCLSALEGVPERSLPAHTMSFSEQSAWIEPYPDDLYRVTHGSVEPVYQERESASLYFVLALQSLAPVGRALLVLRDVIGRTPEEASGILGQDTFTCEGLLDVARGSFSRSYMSDLGRREPLPEAEAFTLSMRYIHQWEAGHADGLLSLLSERAMLQEIPTGAWCEGAEAIEESVRARAFEGSVAGRWRLLPRRANGQMAFAVFQRNEARRSYQAHSIQVLHFDEEGVSEIISFAVPRLFPLFGLLPEVPLQG